jgi:hypothetical protein
MVFCENEEVKMVNRKNKKWDLNRSIKTLEISSVQDKEEKWDLKRSIKTLEIISVQDSELLLLIL